MGDLDWLSFFLDICPGIGETKAILELISGKDLITKEDLNAFDRATCAISLVPAGGWLAKISKFPKAAKNAKKFEKLMKWVKRANEANDYVDKFNAIMVALDDSGYDTSTKKLDPILIIAKALFPVKEGKYIIHSTINYNYVWDVDINSSNLQIWERHGGLNQQFYFKPSITGIYTIYCVQNGKALDCEYSSKDNGANAWVYEPNDTSAQHWHIKDLSGNPYPCPQEISCYTQIDYSETKRCIDLKSSNTQNDTNLWLYKSNETNAQKWLLEPVN